MKSPPGCRPQRKGIPRCLKGIRPQGHILRPFEKWLFNLLDNDIWVDSRQGGAWLDTLRAVASDHGCRIICDRRRHWAESIYVLDYRKRGPTILAGGATLDKYCCTTILHELGHHILIRGKRHPSDRLAGEEEAWGIAQAVALEHRLPLEPHIKRQALYSYRYYELLERTSGSRRKNRHRSLPRSWRLELSRRSSQASTGSAHFSMGKRGRRHAKRFIKKSTVKAERRKPLDND